MFVTTPALTGMITAGFLAGMASGIVLGAAISRDADESITLPFTSVLPAVVQDDEPEEDDPDWDAELHGNGIVGPAWDCTRDGDRICQTPVNAPDALPSSKPIVSTQVFCADVIRLVGCERVR